MDLQDTRAIPMWLAHPVLPVAVGAFLFVALAVVSNMERAEPLDVGPAQFVPELGPERSAGTLRVPEGAVPVQGASAAGKELRQRSQRGDFAGALKVLRSQPVEAWARARLYANQGAYDAAEDLLIQKAGEILLFRAGKMEKEQAAAALESLLATDGVAGHPVEVKLREALEALR